MRAKYSLMVEPQWIWRWYRPFRFLGKRREKPLYVFMADGKRNHGGMFDRIKGMLTVYAVAKAHRADFRICFTSPFLLSDYLLPNMYDWRVEEDELCYNYPLSRPLIVYGEYSHPDRLLRRRRGETHVYYGYDSIDKVNERYGTAYTVSGLYKELFRPNERLQERLDTLNERLGEGYIACHLRLTNLLGDSVELFGNYLKVLPEEEREPMMERCCEVMRGLMTAHPGRRLLLCTDSNVFMEYVRRVMPEVVFVEGTAKHIDTAGETSDEENMKMFMDYYVMAGASHVYSIIGGGLYASQFSEYAAKIGGAEFERVEI